MGVDRIGLSDLAGACGKASGRAWGLIRSGCMICQEHVVWQLAVCVG